MSIYEFLAISMSFVSLVMSYSIKINSWKRDVYPKYYADILDAIMKVEDVLESGGPYRLPNLKTTINKARALNDLPMLWTLESLERNLDDLFHKGLGDELRQMPFMGAKQDVQNIKDTISENMHSLTSPTAVFDKIRNFRKW